MTHVSKEMSGKRGKTKENEARVCKVRHELYAYQKYHICDLCSFGLLVVFSPHDGLLGTKVFTLCLYSILDLALMLLLP